MSEKKITEEKLYFCVNRQVTMNHSDEVPVARIDNHGLWLLEGANSALSKKEAWELSDWIYRNYTK